MKFERCKISKKVLNTLVTEVFYLPEEYAVVGKKINIRINKEWDYGWEVVEVTDSAINYVIESTDINTRSKPAEVIYRGQGPSKTTLRRGDYTTFEPKDRDHQ